jgi:hypothetical protein
MDVLRIEDLDHYAKNAVLVVACRANQHSGVAVVSVARIAEDMSCHFNTAYRALRRAVESGYLTVDKSPGKTSAWTVTLTSQVTHPYPTGNTTLTSPRGNPYLSGNRKDVLDKDITHDRPTPNGAGRGENLAGRVLTGRARLQALTPEAIAACSYCDEGGWLWRDGCVVRCSHQVRRAVTDLTVEDIVGFANPEARRDR